MIIRDIDTNELFDVRYSHRFDEYQILKGNGVIRVLKPCVFRFLTNDENFKEYKIEKDDI